jgi:hypothetical protein
LPHFQLVRRDGEVLGIAELTQSAWRAGELIYRGSIEGNLRVVDVIKSDDPQTFAILVVDDPERNENP